MLHGKLNCWMNGVRSTYSVHLGRESAWEGDAHPWEGRGPAFQKARVTPAAVASGWESHWNHLVPSTSLWSLKWLSFPNPLNLLLPSLQTLQPCRKSKSFVSKSKIFIVHILKPKCYITELCPDGDKASQCRWLGWGRAGQNCRQLICANGTLQRGLKDSLKHQRQTSP